MTWVRTGLTTQLVHEFNVFPPGDHWAQVDIWLPDPFGCPGFNPGNGNTPYFLWQPGANDGLAAFSDTSPIATWLWTSAFGGAATGPVSGTTYTVGYHVHGSTVDWYVDGVLVLSDTGLFIGAFNKLILNHAVTLCCCDYVYYTNVLVGTSQGAGDLFSDDFSGGLANWAVQSVYVGYPTSALLVGAPADVVCPTLTVSPTRGQQGATMTLTGTGFTPGSPLTLYWAREVTVPIEGFNVTADGSGNFTTTLPVPLGVGTDSGSSFPSALTVIDGMGLAGCANFTVCGARRADGIRADVDSEGFNTDTPTPLIAFGGLNTSNNNPVVDYIWHDGAHWVLWMDPSAIDNQGVFNPIPPNHTLTATRISADGTSVSDYPINTGYRYDIAKPPNAEDFDSQHTRICDGVRIVDRIFWDRVWWFEGWDKPVYDAKFASDGTNLWVGVLTRESVNYQYLSNQAGFDINSVQAGNPEGFTYQTTRPSHAPGSTYDPIINISIGTPDDFCYRTAFPVSDGGDGNSGIWDPPRVRMFCFNGGAFNDIGTMDALYCPGQHDSPEDVCYATQNVAGHGSFFSAISLAASPAEPGVCHLVWSEGGDWGSYGLATGATDGCPCPLTWDGGPPNRDYRIGYSTWTPTAKASETNLWSSHIDRGLSTYTGAGPGFWYYDSGVPTGYNWPTSAAFAATNIFTVRNDSGRPILFLSFLETVTGFNTSPNYTIIGGEPTLHAYDISSGTPVALQQLNVSLLPNEAETEIAYPTSGSPIAANTLTVGGDPGSSFTPQEIKFASDLPDARCPFGVSDIYDDPLLGDTPVYLIHVPWAYAGPTAFADVAGFAPMRGFYRIPVDMSGTFDMLDGVRQYDYTILPIPGGDLYTDRFGNASFFSDPHNIWFPATALAAVIGNIKEGVWVDRICQGIWQGIRRAETPGDFSDYTPVEVGYSACAGFHYDPAADSISVAAPIPGGGSPHLFAVTTLYICRGCQKCQCGSGVHIAHRI